MKRRLTNIGLLLLLLTPPLLSAGCSTAGQTYRPLIPRLGAKPQVADCTMTALDGTQETKKCVTVLLDDLAAIVTELEAACIGAGYKREDCIASQ